MDPQDRKQWVIWRLIDDRPGHIIQSAGLCDALSRKRDVKCIDIAVESPLLHFVQWVFGIFPLGLKLPAPDLIVGAGHRTHFALLAARKKYAGKAVVLMSPSLPSSWFDLCVVPEHDQVHGDNILPTSGVLNAIQRASEEERDRLLVLLGGTSKHFNWSDQALVKQISAVISSAGDRQVVLTDSRRTPDSFRELLGPLLGERVVFRRWQETPEGWLSDQLSKSCEVWVTPDSVSMVYEALTSGAAVGLLDLEPKKESRVVFGLNLLRERGWVTDFDQWLIDPHLKRAGSAFSEAERVADWILERWL